ncbi:MAG: hydrolase 1, exosortase A system-associated, partial [Pseudonocardiaceae bacterium]
GDSEGELRTFESVDEDLRAAANILVKEVPSVREIAIWGLCDAASAALMYAGRDDRICGLALANPWVRTEEGYAKTMVKHYYGARFRQFEFWKKLLAGQVNVRASLHELLTYLDIRIMKSGVAKAAPFPERMALSLARFPGRVLLLISGQDLTAQEFEEMTKTSPLWRDALKRSCVEWRRLEEATHTFSSETWRADVGRWTIAWLRSW